MFIGSTRTGAESVERERAIPACSIRPPRREITSSRAMTHVCARSASRSRYVYIIGFIIILWLLLFHKTFRNANDVVVFTDSETFSPPPHFGPAARHRRAVCSCSRKIAEPKNAHGPYIQCTRNVAIVCRAATVVRAVCAYLHRHIYRSGTFSRKRVIFLKSR